MRQKWDETAAVKLDKTFVFTVGTALGNLVYASYAGSEAVADRLGYWNSNNVDYDVFMNHIMTTGWKYVLAGCAIGFLWDVGEYIPGKINDVLEKRRKHLHGFEGRKEDLDKMPRPFAEVRISDDFQTSDERFDVFYYPVLDNDVPNMTYTNYLKHHGSDATAPRVQETYFKNLSRKEAIQKARSVDASVKDLVVVLNKHPESNIGKIVSHPAGWKLPNHFTYRFY